MGIDFSAISRIVHQPSVIADIFVILFSVLILFRNFHRGFINVLLKGTACYVSAIFIIPMTMGFLSRTANVPTAFVGAIVAFLIVAFVLNNVLNKLTPTSSYSVIDSLLGLLFGLVEIILLLFVVSGCQVYLQKYQKIDLPWARGFDDKNLTGSLLELVRPYSAKYIEQFSDPDNLHTLQSKIRKHLKIEKYFPSKVHANNAEGEQT